jgi:alpha-amylase/alpha-mannosidase (GH57 family)
MKYIMIFHGNLNYAYLTPDRYDFVIRQSYELIFDTMRERFWQTPYVFEASGYTLEQIAQRTPDVLEKLKEAIGRGQCEFMGSPYAHPMLPNFPQEDGLWSLRFALDSYERLLGIRPKSFWNPECGWRGYIPQQVLDAGYSNLIGDFEAYSRSSGADGKPLRPEIYEKEHSKEPAFYNFGFKYDLPGEERAIHFPFNRVAGLKPDQLRMFLRTDRIAQFGVRYFMGMEGYSFEDYLSLIKKYSQQPEGEPEGALIIFADDAEYVGTNGWFRLKYQNLPDNVFEATPESKEKLIGLVEAGNMLGGFTTFERACVTLPPLAETITFDDDSAWHGARASTWAGTPMARLLRPWQDMVRDKLRKIADTLDESQRKQIWYYLTNSFNSDGQWPPTLPDAPHIIHPFNYAYCFENLLQAELLVGGVDRGGLATDPVRTLQDILTPQQDLILRKAETLIQSGDAQQRQNAQAAKNLILRSRNVDAMRALQAKILYPSDYTVRADALVAARRLVGGVEIEKN